MGIVTTLPREKAFTREDLDAMPDDGRRYELLDGMLIVAAAPSFRHQRASGKLHLLLEEALPEDQVVLYAPFDVALDEDTVLEPDLLVAPREAFTDKDLPTAPLLAVEILSPTTRRYDTTLKLNRFESAGCPAYWVVDPDVPEVTAWELRDGRYVEVAHVIGHDEWHATSPVEVTICPAGLLD